MNAKGDIIHYLNLSGIRVLLRCMHTEIVKTANQANLDLLSLEFCKVLILDFVDFPAINNSTYAWGSPSASSIADVSGLTHLTN